MIRYQLTEGAQRPKRASDGAAGFDLFAIEERTIQPGDRQIVHTGVSLALPLGMVGLIRDRSSLALRGLSVSGGVIDSDYRGEIKIILTNHSPHAYRYSPGTRVAQIIFIPCYMGEPVIGELDKTRRGNDGFGSTGS